MWIINLKATSFAGMSEKKEDYAFAHSFPQSNQSLDEEQK